MHELVDTLTAAGLLSALIPNWTSRIDESDLAPVNNNLIKAFVATKVLGLPRW